MSLNLNLNNLLWLSIFIVLTIGETTTNYLHLEINGYIRLLINLFLIIIFLLKFFLGSIEKKHPNNFFISNIPYILWLYTFKCLWWRKIFQWP